MFQHYHDILSRIADAPRWFDEHGVPRYCEFVPSKLANIYARECALLEIACQDCGRIFIAALDEKTANEAVAVLGDFNPHSTLAELISSRAIEYGDPPNVDCCRAGTSMTSVTRRVLEYWRRYHKAPIDLGSENLSIGSYIDWQRDPTLEIEIESAD